MNQAQFTHDDDPMFDDPPYDMEGFKFGLIVMLIVVAILAIVAICSGGC